MLTDLLVLTLIRYSAVRYLAHPVLRGEGHRVVPLRDYEKAHSILQTGIEPDLVLIEPDNFNIYGLHGWRQLLLQREKSSECLSLSPGEQDTLSDAHSLGVTRFLMKPAIQKVIESLVKRTFPPHSVGSRAICRFLWSWLGVLSLILLPIFAMAQSDFSIVVLPDTQYYSSDYPATLKAQTQWIVDNQAKYNIRAVIGVGDIVNGGGEAVQWQAADTAFKTLEGKVPYFLPLGNHDYNNNSPLGRTSSATNFNKYFGASRYATSYSGFLGNLGASNENFAGMVQINGKNFLIIALEFLPRTSSLQWAAGVIQQHPDAEVIITTHAYQNYDNTHLSMCDQYDAESYNAGSDNDGDEMWTNLASRFPNISLVLSGHIINGDKASAAHQIEPGINGNMVNAIMADYQDLPNGGNGYLRLLQFHPSTNTIDVSTYSPTLKANLLDTANQFTTQWHATSATGTGTMTGQVQVAGTFKCATVAGATVNVGSVRAVTDSSGKFSMSGIPLGVQIATVNAAGYPPLSKQITIGPAPTYSSNLQLFIATGSGTVSGMVTDANGIGIPGAKVTVVGSSPSTTADANGKYSLSGVPATSAQLTATSSDYVPLTQQISVTAAATASLSFQMTAVPAPTTGTITGAITDSSNGVGIPNAIVAYGGSVAGKTTTNSSGTYTLFGVPAGAVTLTATATTFQSTTQTLNLIGGQTATQNILLTPIPTGTISGVVTDSYLDQPLANAAVSYSGGSFSTDANGTYTLTKVPTGSVQITAAANGYQNQTQSVGVTQNQTITQNLVLNPLVVGNISVQVLDATNGLPVLGASVDTGALGGLTDSLGIYTFVGVPAGSQSAMASAPGYSTANSSAAVSVAQGQTSSVTIRLTPLVTTGGITGIVTDATTNGYVGSAVISFNGANAVSGSNGIYTLSNVPGGTQSISVSAEGYVSQTANVSVTAGQPSEQDFLLSAGISTAPSSGTVTGIVTDAITLATLSGVSLSDGLSAVSTDGNGVYTFQNEPLGAQTITATFPGYADSTQNVAVAAGKTTSRNIALAPTAGAFSGTVTSQSSNQPLSGAIVSYAGGSTTTNAQGEFTIPDVPVGPETFNVSLASFSSANVTLPISANETATQDFELTPNSDVGAVYGVVTDASSGQPVSGALVWYFGGSTTTDQSGTYNLSNVPIGVLSLTVSNAGYADTTASILIGSAPASQDFSPVPQVSNATLNGAVTDSKSSAPILGATVTYAGQNQTTDSNGTYAFATVTAGAQTLTVLAPGYSGITQSVVIISGQGNTESFVLNPAPSTGAITGKVIDSSTDLPINGATIQYANGAANTDAAGHFTLPNVPIGSVALTVSTTGYAGATLTQTLRAGQTVTHTFSLAPAVNTGSISGVITDASNGTPVYGATVSYEGGTTSTDPSGNYSFATVPTGTQPIQVSAGGYGSISQSAGVTAGKNTNLNIALTATPTTGVISGTITDASSSTPLNAAVVTYGGGRYVTTASGTYSFLKVTAGSQTVSVSLAGYTTSSQTVTVTAAQTLTQNFALNAIPTTGSLSGRVTDSVKGTALANASVAYAGASTTTDSSGSYSFAKVNPGSQAVSVTLIGYTRQSQAVNIVAGQASVLSFPLVATTGTVTGKITSSAGTALSGAKVAWSGGSVLTGSTGTYTLTSVTPGSVLLTVSFTGYSNTTGTVVVSAGQTASKSFVLTAVVTTGTITGKISNASGGAAVAAATITAGGQTTTSSSTGAYTLAKVAAGTVSVTATKSGWGAQTKSVAVTGGVTATLNIQLATSGIVSGKVTGINSAAISAATVTISGGVIANTVTIATTSTGVYSSGWVPIGTYTVTVTLTGHTKQTKSSTVNTGATTTLNFTSF